MAAPRLRAYDYPWPPADGPVGRSDGLADRQLVIAVGSNRSPDVLAAKFAGVTGDVVMIPARVRGLGVGHSAHVSRRGYLAAAPYDAPGEEASVTQLWLLPEQVAALDETEPNYDRVWLDQDRYAMPGPAQIYATRRQLLAVDGAILRLTSQQRIQQILLDTPAIRDVLTEAADGRRCLPGPDLCDLLADQEVAERVTALLAPAVGARPSGLQIRPDRAASGGVRSTSG